MIQNKIHLSDDELNIYSNILNEDVVGINEDFRSLVKLFEIDTTDYDEYLILKKIHFHRLKKKAITKEMLSFLSKVYIKMNDIRFLNELYWITTSGTDKYLKIASYHFQEIIDINGFHPHNFKNISYPDEIKYNLEDFVEDLKKLKICFIGLPFYFILSFYRLKKHGIIPDIVFIKYHPNKYFHKILKSKFISFLVKVVFSGASINEYTLNKRTDIKKLELPINYDIGFHKIPLIIPKNIIDKFKYGLVNDHWGLLPYLKGRSTIMYAVLFNIPIYITTHYVIDKIDEGGILNFFRVTLKKPSMFKISSYIHGHFTSRVLSSFCSIIKNQSLDYKFLNYTSPVLYEMHPTLKKYVKTLF